MKALAMLDHVMLWVARVFAFVVFSYVMYVFFDASWFCYHALKHLGHYFALRYSMAEVLNYEMDVFLVASILWNITVWWLRKDAGRIYLGLSGTLMFSAYVWRILDALVWHSNWLDWQECFSSGSIMIGFFAMVWIAFRAPGQPRIKLIPTVRAQTPPTVNQNEGLSPTFPSLFRNSVNSI
jgi:hypothetical protein